MGFYNWLCKNTKYIKNFESLKQIHCLYNMDLKLPILDKLDIFMENSYNKRELEEVMQEHGFIFV